MKDITTNTYLFTIIINIEIYTYHWLVQMSLCYHNNNNNNIIIRLTDISLTLSLISLSSSASIITVLREPPGLIT